MFVRYKVTVIEIVSFTDCIWNPASGLLQIGHKIRKNDIDVTIADMTSSSKFFDGFLFLLSSLDTSQSFMSISSLVLELWQFFFIRG